MKQEARLSMREHRPSVYLVTLVFLVLTWILSSLAAKTIFPGRSIQEVSTQISQAMTALQEGAITAEQFSRKLNALRASSPLSSLVNLAISIVSMMLTVGFSFFCLNVSRGAAAGVGTLLDPFGIFFKVLWLNILIGIFTFLWSLLLVIPGIVAAYRYSFAIYILLDDPDKGALQCIRESKALTRGHKWELFVLDLSFIGWHLLTIIPFVSIYVDPYVGTTKANYYRHISGRLGAIAPDGEAAAAEY
jgi:uncharacterized membrane protein